MEPRGVLPTTQFAYQKGLGTCGALCECSIHCRVHWRVGRRLGYSSYLPTLQGSTIWVFSKALLCGYWRFCPVYIDSFHQADHSKFWWMVVEVNWLMLHQECRRAVFWACYGYSCTRRSFFPFWKKADWLLHFDGCCAIPKHQSCSSSP